MKKNKIIKRLEMAKATLTMAAAQNMRMVTPDCNPDERAAFESGIIMMNASAKSVVDAMIMELKKSGVTYGGFVTMDEETELKPAEEEKHEEGES